MTITRQDNNSLMYFAKVGDGWERGKELETEFFRKYGGVSKREMGVNVRRYNSPVQCVHSKGYSSILWGSGL